VVGFSGSTEGDFEVRIANLTVSTLIRTSGGFEHSLPDPGFQLGFSGSQLAQSRFQFHKAGI
jgi:hypothetical protein